MIWLLPALFLSLWPASVNSPALVSIGDVQFKTEIADTTLTRMMGLMYRDVLQPDQAMLFSYPIDQLVSFWMKNVSSPIDILFINHCGTIVKIHENAIPNDTTPISSGEVIRAVLEIKGGTSKRELIRRGANVVLQNDNHQFFDHCVQ